MKLFGLFLITLFFSCFDNSSSSEDFFENCPLDIIYGTGHYLKVPLKVIPQQEIYNVGDTITFLSYFSDSIKDINRDVFYQIKNFPFKPVVQMYKMDKVSGGLTWTDGFNFNDLIIDSIYSPIFFDPLDYSNGYVCQADYKSNYYKFESKLILNTPGTYLFTLFDIYINNVGSQGDILNAEADATPFEGKCPDAYLRICTILEENNNFYNYIDEMKLFDEIHYGQFRSFDKDLDRKFGNGGRFFEWSGFFPFEVVE